MSSVKQQNHQKLRINACGCGKTGARVIHFIRFQTPCFDRIGEDKVPDFVESSLVQELECVKLWQRRIQAAIEQVR